MMRPPNDGVQVYLCIDPVDFRNYALCPVMRSSRLPAR